MDILTVEEAARLIRINRKSLYERIQVNRPPWAQHFGRCIRISRQALLASFREAAPSEAGIFTRSAGQRSEGYPSESDPEAWSPDRFRGV